MEKFEKNYTEREMINVLDTYGDCLLALDRKAEALARWQSILDKYPTAIEYEQIEAKITKALE